MAHTHTKGVTVLNGLCSHTRWQVYMRTFPFPETFVAMMRHERLRWRPIELSSIRLSGMMSLQTVSAPALSHWRAPAIWTIWVCSCFDRSSFASSFNDRLCIDSEHIKRESTHAKMMCISCQIGVWELLSSQPLQYSIWSVFERKVKLNPLI